MNSSIGLHVSRTRRAPADRFAAANQVATLTGVTNERVVYLGRLVAGQFGLVRGLPV